MSLVSADKVPRATQRRVFVLDDNGHTLLFCPTRNITCPSALFLGDKFARDASLEHCNCNWSTSPWLGKRITNGFCFILLKTLLALTLFVKGFPW